MGGYGGQRRERDGHGQQTGDGVCRAELDGEERRVNQRGGQKAAVSKGTRGMEVHFTASTLVVTVSWPAERGSELNSFLDKVMTRMYVYRVWAAMEMMVSRHMESISSRKVSKQQSDGYDQQIEKRDGKLVSQKGQVVE